jgi:hypothetical protein
MIRDGAETGLHSGVNPLIDAEWNSITKSGAVTHCAGRELISSPPSGGGGHKR